MRPQFLRWFTDRGYLILSGLLAVALFQFFGNAVRGYIDTGSLFYWWGIQWFNPQSDTGHGPLLVMLAIYLVWRNLMLVPQGDKERNREWDAHALIVILSGGLLHLLGLWVMQTRISIFGFLAILWGFMTLYGGKRWGRAGLFPVLLLLLAIPMDFFWQEVGLFMRMGMIEVATFVADFAGWGVHANGTQLVFEQAGFTLDVAPACSGIRSLLALSALSLVIGYMQFRGFYRRIAAFLIAFPVAFFFNAFRIILIVWIAQNAGSQAGLLWHDGLGIPLFILEILTVFGWVILWNRVRPECVSVVDLPESITAHPTKKDALMMALFVPSVISLNLMGSLFLLESQQMRSVSIGLEPLPTLPIIVDWSWFGSQVPVTPMERQALPKDTQFMRVIYRGSEDRQISVTLIRSGSDRSSIHRPELCLMAQGWRIDPIRGSSIVEIPVQALECKYSLASLNIEPVGISDAREQSRLLFAFFTEDAWVTTNTDRMFHDVWARLYGNPQAWTYLLIQAPAGEARELMPDWLKTFLTEIIAHLQHAES
jgi:exosortase